MEEDFKHVRYKDESSVRNAEVISSMDVSGTADRPGDGVTLSSHVLLFALSPLTLLKKR